MQNGFQSLDAVKDLVRLLDLVGRPVEDQVELAGPDGGLVLEDAVHGIPMLYRATPTALRSHPTTTAVAMARTILVTSGPATNSSPKHGTSNLAWTGL